MSERPSRFEAPLRIVVLDPAPGVAGALQSGKADKAGLIPPVRVTPQALAFDFAVTVEPAAPGRPPRLAAQGD